MATLGTRLANLATAIATKCKSLNNMVNGNAADLSGLTTTSKDSLVAAINEIKAQFDVDADPIFYLTLGTFDADSPAGTVIGTLTTVAPEGAVHTVTYEGVTITFEGDPIDFGG